MSNEILPDLAPIESLEASSRWRWIVEWIVCGSIGLILLVLMLPVVVSIFSAARGMAAMERTRQVAIAEWQFYADTEKYPEGKTSTEIFQTLLAGRYLTDPSQVYLALPEKTRVLPGQNLTATNVSFDLTLGLTQTSSDNVPTVFQTGFNVSYAPGIPATRLADSGNSSQIWWAQEKRACGWDLNGMAVGYKNLSSLYLRPNAMGGIDHFLRPGYVPEPGAKYRQVQP